LYEMATGQRTFKGTSKVQLMAAILSSDPPPIYTIQPLAPPPLDHVVKKCLSKDPDERWQDAGDVAGQLKWISESGSQGSMLAPALGRRKLRERIYWGIMTILIVAVCALLVAYYRLSL